MRLAVAAALTRAGPLRLLRQARHPGQRLLLLPRLPTQPLGMACQHDPELAGWHQAWHLPASLLVPLLLSPLLLLRCPVSLLFGGELLLAAGVQPPDVEEPPDATCLDPLHQLQCAPRQPMSGRLLPLRLVQWGLPRQQLLLTLRAALPAAHGRAPPAEGTLPAAGRWGRRKGAAGPVAGGRQVAGLAASKAGHWSEPGVAEGCTHAWMARAPNTQGQLRLTRNMRVEK